jgi:hypothetical protein
MRDEDERRETRDERREARDERREKRGERRETSERENTSEGDFFLNRPYQNEKSAKY